MLLTPPSSDSLWTSVYCEPPSQGRSVAWDVRVNGALGTIIPEQEVSTGMSQINYGKLETWKSAMLPLESHRETLTG